MALLTEVATGGRLNVANSVNLALEACGPVECDLLSFEATPQCVYNAASDSVETLVALNAEFSNFLCAAQILCFRDTTDADWTCGFAEDFGVEIQNGLIFLLVGERAVQMANVINAKSPAAPVSASDDTSGTDTTDTTDGTDSTSDTADSGDDSGSTNGTHGTCTGTKVQGTKVRRCEGAKVRRSAPPPRLSCQGTGARGGLRRHDPRQGSRQQFDLPHSLAPTRPLPAVRGAPAHTGARRTGEM